VDLLQVYGKIKTKKTGQMLIAYVVAVLGRHMRKQTLFQNKILATINH
jgi:hypothetical protein